MPIGKVSMDKEKIAENARLLIDEVQRKKPADIKGEFIKSIAVSSTMGPGIMVNPKEKA
jgi:large subunit ribosomal protein L1